jgi:outer membrane biosynthesis protein TonB
VEEETEAKREEHKQEQAKLAAQRKVEAEAARKKKAEEDAAAAEKAASEAAAQAEADAAAAAAGGDAAATEVGVHILSMSWIGSWCSQICHAASNSLYRQRGALRIKVSRLLVGCSC